jgi:UDP-glucose 4-epimerase
VFNIAGGRKITLLELVASINKLLNTKIQPEHADPRTGDVRDSTADITEAKKFLGFEPKVDLEEGLRRSIDYYRSL